MVVMELVVLRQGFAKHYVQIVLIDVRITKIHGDKHTLLKIIHLAKCFPTRATKIGYALRIVQIYLKIHTMMVLGNVVISKFSYVHARSW